MATRNLSEANPENIEMKLGFVNSLMIHSFTFYNEVNFDNFSVELGNYRLQVTAQFHGRVFSRARGRVYLSTISVPAKILPWERF